MRAAGAHRGWVTPAIAAETTGHLILDVPARTLVRGDARLVVGGNAVRLLEAVVRLSTRLGAPRLAVMQAVWPHADIYAQRANLGVQINTLGRLVDRHGWPPLLAVDYGPGGGVLKDGLLHLVAPIEVRSPGPVPLLVPGALRRTLRSLLLSHPDQGAADRLLDKLDV